MRCLSLTLKALGKHPNPRRLAGLVAMGFLSQSLMSLIGIQPAQAQTKAFCQLSESEIAQKEALLKATFQGGAAEKQKYQAQIQQDAAQLRQCRNQTWPQTQAIWLRLYPCDFKPGVLESLMDRIVNKGYNRVYVEVFYDGQVLLPTDKNPTVWPSVVRDPKASNADLLAEAIQKGRERGLSVYAWAYSMNFGYSYGQRSDRQQVLARNGQGQTSLTIGGNSNSSGPEIANGETDKAFIDPYNLQARQDYSRMLQEVLERKPDGVLFDYIRYPKLYGGASLLTKPKQFWIYGNAALQALYSRATNDKGRELIQRYVSRGYLSAGDVVAVDRGNSNERVPLWQGRVPPNYPSNKPLPSASSRQPRLQQELWLLTAAHSYQGVVDFLTAAASPVLRQGIPAGAVFFPEGNRRVGRGFDSRMQPWNQFPRVLQWHPMSYGVCGSTSCIVDQVQTVVRQAPGGTQVSPVLAGAWGRAVNNRPSLEAQMYAIRRAVPQVNSVSHFDFTWLDPQFAGDRRSCAVNYAEN